MPGISRGGLAREGPEHVLHHTCIYGWMGLEDNRQRDGWVMKTEDGAGDSALNGDEIGTRYLVVIEDGSAIHR